MSFFQEIKLSNWRQFENVSVSFSRQVTVITGENGCGKTTILNILGRHFGWDIPFVSTPHISKRSKRKQWSDFREKYDVTSEEEKNEMRDVGAITYKSGAKCKLLTQRFVSSQYDLKYDNRMQISGLYIPSHRPAVSYHVVKNIPTQPKETAQHYQEFQSVLLSTYKSRKSGSPGETLKESLIALALFGFGNEAVASNEEYRELFVNFQKVLQEVLPKNIGFRRLEVRMPDVVLITNSGEFNLDSMSGGINDVFSIAWQIHIYSFDKDMCTVIIDEPENHLHPQMQRTFLPLFARAFPKCRFIISTHSPFIASSMVEANVYGLIYNSRRYIESTKIDEKGLSGTANTLLREIFGVPSNFPIWVENQVKSVLDSVKHLDGKEKSQRIFEQLDDLGLTDYIIDLRLE